MQEPGDCSRSDLGVITGASGGTGAGKKKNRIYILVATENQRFTITGEPCLT